MPYQAMDVTMRVFHTLIHHAVAPMALTLLVAACGEQEAEPTRRTSRPIGAASTEPTSQTPTVPTTTETTLPPTPQTTSGLTWKALLMTGDDSITAFDNARKKFKEILMARGVQAENIKELSIKKSEQTGGVMASTAANMQSALQSMNPGDGSACFVHMTSHGTKTGFMLKGQSYLTPSKLNDILDQTCGTRPTVLLVSACYSGIFIDQTTSKPNRIILTAARKDRTSFGCSPDETYVYWDTCLIENMPTATSWKDLQAKTDACIENKESRGSFTPSEPQNFYGADTTTLPLFGATF